MARLSQLAVSVIIALALPSVAMALEPIKPKFGPEAVPIFEHAGYLRQAPAPDYWALSAFYVPQDTSSSCTLATITMALNALRGVPGIAEDPLLTQASVLATTGDAHWAEEVAEGGPGTTFAEFAGYMAASLKATGIEGAQVETAKPADDAAGLAAFRAVLAANEASADNVLLVAFNQGVVTGDWDGPHASTVGAYDATADLVLIMDVDREWYVPYWTATATLLKAMNKPVSAEHGVLEGDSGGYVLVTRE